MKSRLLLKSSITSLLVFSVICIFVTQSSVHAMNDERLEMGSNNPVYTENRAIGYPIDVTKCYQGMQCVKNGSPVLDQVYLEALYNQPGTGVVRTQLANNTTIEVIESYDFNEFVSSSSFEHGQEFYAEAPYEGLILGVGQGYKFDANQNHSSTSSHYFTETRIRQLEYSLSLPGYVTKINDFRDNLDQQFLDDLVEVRNGVQTYDWFFDRYGTHLIGNAIFGSSITSYYSTTTNSTNFTFAMKNSLSNKMKVSDITGYLTLLANIDNSFKGSTGLVDSDYNSYFYTVSSGVPISRVTDPKVLRNQMADFVYSLGLDDDTTDKDLIGFGEDGLIPLYKLIPNQDDTFVDEFKYNMEKYEEDKYNDVKEDYVIQFHPNKFQPGTENYSDPNKEKGVMIRGEALLVHDSNFNEFGNERDKINMETEFGVSFEEMKALGYNYVKVEVDFYAREVNSGNWDMYLYKYYKHNELYRIANSNNIDHEFYWNEYFEVFNFNIDEMDNYRYLYLRWDAHGFGEDDWYNSEVYVRIFFSRTPFE